MKGGSNNSDASKRQLYRAPSSGHNESPHSKRQAFKARTGGSSKASHRIHSSKRSHGQARSPQPQHQYQYPQSRCARCMWFLFCCACWQALAKCCYRRCCRCCCARYCESGPPSTTVAPACSGHPRSFCSKRCACCVTNRMRKRALLLQVCWSTCNCGIHTTCLYHKH